MLNHNRKFEALILLGLDNAVDGLCRWVLLVSRKHAMPSKKDVGRRLVIAACWKETWWWLVDVGKNLCGGSWTQEMVLHNAFKLDDDNTSQKEEWEHILKF